MVLVLLLLGFGLVAAEVFFPSMGALSIMAGLALIGGVIAGFDVSTSVGWWAMTGVIIGLPCVIVFAFRVFPKTPLGKKMISGGATWSKSDRAAVDHDVQRFVGQIGTTNSLLRPSGIAVFNGERVDVISNGEYIEAGVSVRALSFASNRLVVETVEQQKIND